MGFFNELESIKYYSVIDLIKNNEPYDKKRSVLNGEDVFQLCQKRYQLVEQLLLSLKERIGQNIEIIDISFAQGIENDTNILVRYKDDDKQNYFTICNFEFSDIEILSSDDNLEKYDFVMRNKKMILDIFNKIYDESLDSELSINSTSKKFVINDDFNFFNIKDVNKKIFSIEGSHSLYTKEHLMYNKEKTFCFYPKLKELLFTDDNILKMFQHLHVYEEDLTKVLVKKN